MKKLIPLALAAFATPALAAQNCEYQFQTDNNKSYGEAQISAFIENEMRGTLERVRKPFNVHLSRQCKGSPKEAFTLGMTTDSLYIQNINGTKLADDVVMYTDDPLTISRAQFDTAFTDALKLDTLPKKTQQSTLKMFAFVLAESARFSDVETAVNTVFSNPSCSYQWNDYSNLLRHWKTMSIFANTRGIAKGPQHVGGTRAFLIAPITNSMRLQFNDAVEDGWEVTRYDYNKRQHDKPVSIGTKQCSAEKSVAQS